LARGGCTLGTKEVTCGDVSILCDVKHEDFKNRMDEITVKHVPEILPIYTSHSDYVNPTSPKTDLKKREGRKGINKFSGWKR